MALVKCPECGNEVSDRAVSCPKCGYPLEKKSSQSCEHNSATENNGDAVYAKTDVNNIQPEKINKKIIIPVIAIVAITIVFILSVMLKNKSSVNSIDIINWRMTNSSDSGCEYDGTVVSDSKDPFVAVIGVDDGSKSPSLVFVNDGKGYFHTVEKYGSEPSSKYMALGYMQGRQIKDSDISIIDCEDRSYNDLDSLDCTICSVDVYIELKNKDNGLLFVDLENSSSDDDLYDIAVPIVDGCGTFTRVLLSLPYMTRKVDVTITPKYFCIADEISKDDYVIEKDFYVEEEDEGYAMTFYGSQEITFDNYSNGCVLYSATLIEGGSEKNLRKTKYSNGVILDGSCLIKTYDSVLKLEEISEPKYSFNPLGYIKWEELKE